jgi:hypothetical protein
MTRVAGLQRRLTKDRLPGPLIWQESAFAVDSSSGGIVEPEVGSSVSFSVGVSDWWEGPLLQCRENIPLAVMSLVSLAVLFVFGFSEMEMRDVQRQLDGCGGSQKAAIPIGWTGGASFPRTLSSPAFPPSLPNRVSGPAGCTKSSMTVTG